MTPTELWIYWQGLTFGQAAAHVLALFVVVAFCAGAVTGRPDGQGRRSDRDRP